MEGLKQYPQIPIERGSYIGSAGAASSDGPLVPTAGPWRPAGPARCRRADTDCTFGVRPSSVQRSSGANSRVSSLTPWPQGTGRSLWPVRPPALHWFAAVSATLTHGSSVPHFAHWPSVPRWLTGRQSPLAHGPLCARAITTGPLVPPPAHGPSVPGKLTGRQSPVGARAICGLPTRASDLFKLTPFIRVRGTDRSPIDCLGIACVRVCF